MKKNNFTKSPIKDGEKKDAQLLNDSYPNSHVHNRVVEITKRYNSGFTSDKLDDLINEGTLDYFSTAVGRTPSLGLEEMDAELLNRLYFKLREDVAKKAMGGSADISSKTEKPYSDSIDSQTQNTNKKDNVKIGDYVVFLQGRDSKPTKGKVTREVDDYNWEINHQKGVEMIPKNDIVKVVQKPKKKWSIFKNGGEASSDLNEEEEEKNKSIRFMLAENGLDSGKYSQKDLKTISHFSYPYRVSNFLANKVWGLVQKSGFEGFKNSNIAALNIGNGELLRFIPDSVNRVDALERDADLFKISKVSFPQEYIHVYNHMEGIRNKYDLAVGVCGGLKTIIHEDIMFNLKSGALMVYVVSTQLLDANSAKANNARKILNEHFDFIEAFRLPSDVMAGFDLIALKRK